MNPKIVYVPGDSDTDEAVRLGAAWLQEQQGDNLVLVSELANYQNNSLLPRLTAGAKVAKPGTLWQVGWQGGPVLSPWPTDDVLSEISEGISNRMTAVCVLEWGEDRYFRAWVQAQAGVNLLTGETGSDEELLSPVVTVAMRFLAQDVNHANGLAQTYDKEIVIQALQRLVRAGYRFDVDNLVAWALANKFTGTEAKRLREYATKVLQGHRFRLSGRGLLVDDIVGQWEREAQQQ